MNENGNEYKHCLKCSEKIFKEAEICPKCGVRQTQLRSKKNKYVAATLAIFLGMLGIHKFYLRKKMWGLLYLFGAIVAVGIFITIPVSIFEGLSYLLMSKEEFDHRYNRLESLVS